jgi:hypothetical protein
MKTWLVAVLFTGIAFAGCTDSPDEETDGSGDGAMAGEAQTFQIELPEWGLGDYWVYDNSFIDDYALVVSEDNGATWTLDTDQPDLAFFHDAMGAISYLGDIRKSDLAGSQEDGPVKWLDFPLQDGKTWKATWDGSDFDMVSHVSEDGIAHIVASIGDLEVSQLVYDSSIGWFESIIFGDSETGKEYGRMDLKESGSNFDGELVRIDAVLADSNSYAGAEPGGSTVFDASGASDDADAYLTYSITCAAGAFEFGIGTAQGASNVGADAEAEPQGRSIATVCPYGENFEGIIGTVPANGDQWGTYFASESPDLELSYELYWRNYERITL